MNELEIFREKLKNVEIKADTTPFNILNLMYQKIGGKEVLQSKILAGLLTPEENHLLNDLVVSAFFEEIGLKFDAEKMQNFSVATERTIENGKRIDIFISWKTGNEKHAVIIENKLNDASDLPNQLNDYHDFIAAGGYKIDKIVYMPLNENKSAKDISDIKPDVLAKTEDFPATGIVKWLGKCIENGGKENAGISALIQYKEFINCLISSTEYQIMKAKEKAKEIVTNWSLKEVQKLEKLFFLIGETEEWGKVRFELISQRIKDELGEPLKDRLITNYGRRNETYAEFYFEPYEYWLELWLMDDYIELCICSHNKQDFVEILGKKYEYGEPYGKDHYYAGEYFEYPATVNDANMDKLAGAVVPVLRELAKYENKNK